MERGGPVLVTGVAGFIGFHAADRLLREGRAVVGLDHLGPAGDPALKQARLERLQGRPGFTFAQIDLVDAEALSGLLEVSAPTAVIHLAAEAGVRRSIDTPGIYAQSNLVGFLNVLEACRHARIGHLVYASSSSVYGAGASAPFAEAAPVDHPLSLYAATKRANELMAHTYSHLYALPTTGLRFFTVYGPWGRPDMAAFLFTKALLEGRPITVFNEGRLQRDFTYVDDVVEALSRMVDCPPRPAEVPSPSPNRSTAPFRLYNVGNSQPVPLMDFIAALERATGARAELHLADMQPGDVPLTAANTQEIGRDFGFRPSTPLDVGLARFVAWYREHYAVG